MMHHELKVWPEFFMPIVNRKKLYEIRNEYDRHFEPGDTLTLSEFDPDRKPDGRTGRSCEAVVLYVNRGLGLEKDYCAMSIGVKHVKL